jgi:hypothetical protein
MKIINLSNETWEAIKQKYHPDMDETVNNFFRRVFLSAPPESITRMRVMCETNARKQERKKQLEQFGQFVMPEKYIGKRMPECIEFCLQKQTPYDSILEEYEPEEIIDALLARGEQVNGSSVREEVKKRNENR